MKTGWTEVALGEVCQFRYGKALKAEQRSGTGWPVYGSNGPVGRHRAALTDGPTIVIGRKGSYGEVHYSDGPAWPIDTTFYVDCDSTSCDLKWLSYRLAGLRLDEMNRAAAVPGLNREDAYRTRLLLPPHAEQRRIARVLDVADRVRNHRRVAFTLLEELRAAVFSSAVGACDESWPLVQVADLVDETNGGIRTGPFGSQLLHSEFVDKGVAVLGIDNAVANEFCWGAERHITEAKYAQLRRYTVHPGDVLITIMGTCGRVAIVPKDIGRAINTKHLCCITLDQSQCLPEFLHAYFLRHPIARHHLASRARGAIMAGLNMTIIKELLVRLAPIDVQNQLVDRLAAIDKADGRATEQREHLDALFGSLQQRAFTGAL
jgi:type I restriction enzyme S subunit